jgi:hypothetical protein
MAGQFGTCVMKHDSYPKHQHVVLIFVTGTFMISTFVMRRNVNSIMPRG